MLPFFLFLALLMLFLVVMMMRLGNRLAKRYCQCSRKRNSDRRFARLAWCGRIISRLQIRAPVFPESIRANESPITNLGSLDEQSPGAVNIAASRQREFVE